MNKKQADDLLGIIAGAYQSFELTKERVKIWTEMLSEIDFDIAKKRAKHHISTSKFPPSIAEVLNPEEASKRKQKVELDTSSPAALMNGGYRDLVD